VTFDISELKASERIKDEFIATVSHELRTPLTSIHGSLGLLGGGVTGELSEDSARLVRIAQENCQRLVRLIDDILSIAKIESEKMQFHLQPVPIDDLIARAIEANQDFAKQYGVRLQARPGIREARVLADMDRLMQVLTNLLSNAVKHSPRDGVVLVGVQRHDGYWRVSVVDNGPGIPESFRENIFSKFAQADGSDRRKGGGTGLGLSICKAIIDRLGGRIGFASESGVRTSFHFELPVMQRKAIVNVLAAQSAGPDVDGPATLRVLRERVSAESAPAIFITAKVEAGDMQRYRKMGVLDVIVKPFDTMGLPGQIEQIWQRYRSSLNDSGG
jgi:signal transduction histidine kinase